jgi:hypothetical protein
MGDKNIHNEAILADVRIHFIQLCLADFANSGFKAREDGSYCSHAVCLGVVYIPGRHYNISH